MFKILNKHVYRDSHITSSAISQSSFFEEVCGLIFASSHIKLHGYIDFFKFHVTIKKIKNSTSFKKEKPQPIFTKFSINHHSVLMYPRTKFQLVNRNLPELHNFEKFKKKFEINKFEGFNRFWPNSISKVLDRYIIFVCSSRTIAQILRKVELPRTFKKKFKIP